MELLQSCVNMRQISYLKSFKIQDDDVEDDEECDEDEDEDEENEEDEYVIKKQKKKKKNYFHYIKYAIQNASIKSNHVNMQPCYGYDLTPSFGNLLDSNSEFIEPSLPPIHPPSNDFHVNLLDV